MPLSCQSAAPSPAPPARKTQTCGSPSARSVGIASVVFADVAVGAVEQVAGGWEPVLLQDQSDFASHRAVAVLRLRPAGEPDLANDRVDVRDNVLDDDGSVGWRVLAEY